MVAPPRAADLRTARAQTPQRTRPILRGRVFRGKVSRLRAIRPKVKAIRPKVKACRPKGCQAKVSRSRLCLVKASRPRHCPAKARQGFQLQASQVKTLRTKDFRT
jgi:hypothetical protein